MERRLRMGMVGGGRDAFIGAVHRKAAALDGAIELVAGCLSSSPERALASGRDLGLEAHRIYASWRDMVLGESERPAEERLDLVSIVTPNDTHYEIAAGFVSAGFNVVLDKPMVHTTAQARELARAVERAGVVFCVTYNYSGYPMVKQAREMIAAGEVGDVRRVMVEYHQGWLAGRLEQSGHKQAGWRTDPARSGAGGAIGDIGSHAEHLVSYVTGLELESICADLSTMVSGRRLDDDASVLMRFVPRGEAAARGVLTASQVCVGRENDLRLRVWGTRGGLEWRQESPDDLWFWPMGEPGRLYRRGNDYVGEAAKLNTRLPFGHPEAFIEAFANVYMAAGRAIRDRESRGEARADSPEVFDYPGVEAGARGVHFIEKTVESSASDEKWIDARWSLADE